MVLEVWQVTTALAHATYPPWCSDFPSSLLVLSSAPACLGFYASSQWPSCRIIGRGFLGLTVSGREGLKGSQDDARQCVMTAAFVTFWGQATGILLGLLLSYIIMVADAVFGTDEEIEKVASD